MALAPARTIVSLGMHDPRVRPLLDGLYAEYSARYGEKYHGKDPGAENELTRYPAQEFAAPHGVLLVIQEDGESVAGGAFRRYDERTAELKRIWTHEDHRRRGLGRAVLAALEDAAAARGYERLYLTTGPRQPEAKALYLAAGYMPLFDLDADPEELGHLAFRKALAPWRTARGRALG